MEKLFSFNKFFLFFCAVFVFEWLALQIVGYMRLTSLAKVDGERILAWQWPHKNLRSVIEIYDTKILKRDTSDAIVKVLAKQSIQADILSPGNKSTAQEPKAVVEQLASEKQEIIAGKDIEPITKCGVTLTYYRTNSQWFLGKVECE